MNCAGSSNEAALAAHMRKLDAEYVEESAREQEHNRVYAMPLGEAMNDLFGGEHEVITIINDTIQDRLTDRWASDQHALDEDLAADREYH